MSDHLTASGKLKAVGATVALATHWINDGTASAVVQAIRRETNARHALMLHHLAGWQVQSQPDCFHAWLRLPDTLSPNEAARRRWMGSHRTGSVPKLVPRRRFGPCGWRRGV